MVQRYREANDRHPARPGKAVREAVLAHARSQLGATPQSLQHTPPAANDSRWKLRALGSLAVVGLIGLLVMQFERGTPEEQALALGQPEQRAERATKAPSPEKAGPASGAPATPAAGGAPATTQSPMPKERKPEPQPAAPTHAESTLPAAPSGRTAGNAPSSPRPDEQPPSAQADAALEAAPRQRASPPPAPSERSVPEAFSQSSPRADQNADVQAQPTAPPMAASPAPTEKPEAGRTTREPSALGTAPGAGQASRPRRSPPLHDAVISDQTAQVQQLLAQGANINARDAQGRTALMLAAMGSNPGLVELLMKAGADPDLRDHAGWRAVDLAEQAGHTDWLPLFTHPKR